jgi:hypothetical protein
MRQQHGGRFVLRVLGHQLALEGALQDGLPQPLSPQKGSLNLLLHLHLFYHRQPSLNFSDDRLGTVWAGSGRPAH